jgi:hypothetical protein
VLITDTYSASLTGHRMRSRTCQTEGSLSTNGTKRGGEGGKEVKECWAEVRHSLLCRTAWKSVFLLFSLARELGVSLDIHSWLLSHKELSPGQCSLPLQALQWNTGRYLSQLSLSVTDKSPDSLTFDVILSASTRWHWLMALLLIYRPGSTNHCWRTCESEMVLLLI